MREAPISVGKAYAVAASYYLLAATRAKEEGNKDQAAYAYAKAVEVSDWARDEYGRSDTFTAICNEKE